jgi:hypothetical protein
MVPVSTRPSRTSTFSAEAWVADHIAIDGGVVQLRRTRTSIWADPPSDLIADAVKAEPRIGLYTSGYFARTALPPTLQAAEPLARRVDETGWRTSCAEGPTRDELVKVIEGATSGPPAGR